ncbi:chromatin-remodeling ATPase INO80 [Rhizophagus irregularis DAOM 197198w]|uniref:Chromatin-remodeling ATPase INO80 n=2 Tax=Rhizophagus irregularis (strain DAOM 197198w) TaxID=1432141 RepID=A0A015K2M2_RHIIW|nr:chromatin-remodeling ATPase INO80 [Rhizophagus irregularis DAOM 197198w]
MSSYNYPRDRSHTSRSYSSDQQPQGQPPLLPPPTSTRSSSFNLNTLLNSSEEQPITNYLPPITQHNTQHYTQPTIPFSYHSQPSSSSHYGHNHTDYSSSLPHSVPIQHQPIPPFSTANWEFTESPTRQLQNPPYKIDHGPSSLPYFNSGVSQAPVHRIREGTSIVPQETLLRPPPVMSIPQLLSGDPSEDLDYSYSKSQNGSGAYDEYSRRSAVAQTTTSDSADDKDSAATVTDVNTDNDVRDSAQSGDTTEEENLLPPVRKPSESKTGLPVKSKPIQNPAQTSSRAIQEQESPKGTKTTHIPQATKTKPARSRRAASSSSIGSVSQASQAQKNIKTVRLRRAASSSSLDSASQTSQVTKPIKAIRVRRAASSSSLGSVSQASQVSKPPSRLESPKPSRSNKNIQAQRKDIGHTSGSSTVTAAEMKSKYALSEPSSDSSSSDLSDTEDSNSDFSLEGRYSEDVVKYMIQLHQRTKRTIDEYEKRCKEKREKLRRKFLTRINNRKAIIAKVTETDNINKKRKRAPRKAKKKHDTKRAKKLLFPEIETESEIDDKKRESISLKIRKQKEALELEERRRIWKDIVRNAIPRVHKIVNQSITSRTNNARKIAQICQKEARKATTKCYRSQKDIQTKAKQAMRQMLMFWKRNEKEERELRKKAEKEALEKMRIEEELREAKRQARKLNFLITQTELYSHFVGKKINPEDEHGESSVSVVAVSSIQETGSSSDDTNNDTEIDAETDSQAPTSFKDINFDEEDDITLAAKARASAKNALAQVKAHTKIFDGERKALHIASGKSDLSLSNNDLDHMNFQNPSSMPSAAEIKQPSLLAKVTLKDYQLRGLNWLANLYEQGINGILADEMGLGKTVQSISLMAHLAEAHNIWGPFLVIAPASTLHNWQKEISEFLPSFKTLPYWGNPKDRNVLRKTLNKKNMIFNADAPFHVVITSYQLIVQDKANFERTKWQYMILDEAQAIKSSSSARWKTLLGFQCRNRLLLTGTPIQNSMQELWALLHFIMPTLFDSHQEFSEWFSKDIESHAENKGSLNEHQLKRLHMILKPFMLRRVKKNVQNELGDKIEKEVYCQLTARQRMLYRGLREKISVSELLEKAATLPDNDSVDSLMNLVMQFRKVCNHPELFERADVVAPFSFCKYSLTWMISREGDNLYLPYSTKNLIKYEIPKTVYRYGILNIPSHHSNAGFRTKTFNHLMNIWRPDYINESLRDSESDTFTFLKFIDTSPSGASQIFFGHIIKRWIIHLLQRTQCSRRRFYLTQDESYQDAPVNTYARFLIMETSSSISPINADESSVLGNLTNIFAQSSQYELAVLDPCYIPKVIAPPIEFVCRDKCFYNDKERTMFDNSIRATLIGVDKLLSEKDRVFSPIGQFLTGPEGKSIIGRPLLRGQGFSHMRVPAVKKLIMDSGKLYKLDKLLEELRAGGHRVLIYFQMTRMIDLMEEYLSYRQYKYLRLDGSSKISDRRDMVEDWQTKPEIFIFLLSTRAGGLGINLTAADTVIFYDSDWNPTVDQQAMDRAHRLGQTKQVTVYRLITKGTIEERILQRAKQKDEIQKVVISGGEFKQVDFKPREIVSLLLEDDELEAKLQLKRKAEEEDIKKKGRSLKRRKKDAPTTSSVVGSSKSLEDLWHEEEPPMAETEGSGVTTPASSVGGKKRKRVAKAAPKPAPTKRRSTRATRSSKTPVSEPMNIDA